MEWAAPHPDVLCARACAALAFRARTWPPRPPCAPPISSPALSSSPAVRSHLSSSPALRSYLSSSPAPVLACGLSPLQPVPCSFWVSLVSSQSASCPSSSSACRPPDDPAGWHTPAHRVRRPSVPFLGRGLRACSVDVSAPLACCRSCVGRFAIPAPRCSPFLPCLSSSRSPRIRSVVPSRVPGATHPSPTRYPSRAQPRSCPRPFEPHRPAAVYLPSCMHRHPPWCSLAAPFVPPLAVYSTVIVLPRIVPPPSYPGQPLALSCRQLSRPVDVRGCSSTASSLVLPASVPSGHLGATVPPAPSYLRLAHDLLLSSTRRHSTPGAAALLWAVAARRLDTSPPLPAAVRSPCARAGPHPR